MGAPSVIDLIEQHPEQAREVFTNVEGAVQQVLPGNADLHPRYEGIDGVGLAYVLGRDDRRSYYPLDLDVLRRVSFVADNSDTQPDAWLVEERHTDVLEAEVLERLRLLGGMAIAKLRSLELYPGRRSSFSEEGLRLGPGHVGFAGGIRHPQIVVLSAISGLWELHDHIVTGITTASVARAATTGQTPTSEMLVYKFELAFDLLDRFRHHLFGDTPPDRLERWQLGSLLERADVAILGGW